jgi:hypothetical protein
MGVRAAPTINASRCFWVMLQHIQTAEVIQTRNGRGEFHELVE